MDCPRVAGQRCPRPDCLGRSDPGVCRHVRAIHAWRAGPAGGDFAASPDPGFRPRLDPGGRKVRLGMWAPCLGLGGAEAWMLALARHLDPSTIECVGTVVTEGAGHVYGPTRRAFEGLMPVGVGLDPARKLAEASDVILSWSALDLEGLLRTIARRPAIVHAAHFSPGNPLPDGDAARLAPTDRWVAVSEIAREWIPARFRDDASVIWNAVEPSRSVAARGRAMMRAAWGVPIGAKAVGYIGRLEREKGADALPKLDAALPPDHHLVVVGSGSLEGTLRASASPRMRVVGPDPDAGSCLAAFDRLIVPSRSESFGLSLAEGLAAGVPTLAARAGIAAIVPGLVREVDPDAPPFDLARAVAEDFLDESGARARAARGLEFARSRLSVDRFAREWGDLIRSAAPARPAPKDPVRLAMLADLCRWGSGHCGCGDGPPRDCSRPGRAAKVRRAQCLECVASEA